MIESSNSVSLAVLGDPFTTLSNYSMTLVENRTLTLTCEAEVPDTGHPDWSKGVTFTWKKDFIPIVSNGGELTMYALNNLRR